MFVVRDRLAGNMICPVETNEEGEALIKAFESEDKMDGIYEENFYEVAYIDD